MARRLLASLAATFLLILIGGVTLAVAACSSNDNANNTMNVDENLATSDMNAVDMNATDMNATDMNASGNAADLNVTARTATPAPKPATGPPGTSATNGSEVRPGRGNFSKPPPMEVGGWYTIEFHAGPNDQALSEQAQGAPVTASQPIHISRHMKVTLQPDANFLVRAKSEVDQDTGADWAATWDWDVQPVTEGAHSLIAHVEVMMHDSDGKLVHYDQYDSRVAVQVKVGSWEGLLIGISHAKTLGDKLTTLFQSWRGTLLALAGLISAGFAVRWAIRAGSRPPSGADPGKDGQAS